MLVAGISLKQLRSLIAVAELRSMTAAAAALNQTTPAIHSQIRKLEDLVGRPLLERAPVGGGFVPTAAGTAMLRAARRIEANLSQAEAEIAAQLRGFEGQVTLAVVSTAKYFAPRLVRMLRDTCPEIGVTLRVGNRESVISDLDHGIADLAVMGRPPRRPLTRAEPLGPHPHGIVLPPDHPLAGADGFDPEALLSETFVSREEGSGTRILMMRYFDRLPAGHAPPMMSMSSNESIKQAVIAGLGIAFLSLHTVCDELASGRLVQLRGPGLPVMRQWYLVRLAGPDRTAAVQRIGAAIAGLDGAYFPRLCA
ncbi:MAG: LysR family transcriptional regulator [Gemmobacter sp.]